MAYTTINKSSDHFNTVLYTGNGGTKSVTGVGFQPDWVWVKSRVATHNHFLWDAVRGVQNRISSNLTTAEGSDTNGLTSFDSDGFTLGDKGSINSNTDTYASWNWLAGTTSGISTDSYSTITPTSYSFNATNGCSIVKYNGNGTAGAGVPHGLGVAPKIVIVKNTASGSTGWYCYHKDIGAANVIYLNSNAGSSNSSTVWNGWNTDTFNFYLGTNTGVNDSGTAHIAYCFAEKTGYSKIGSYNGNGNVDGNFLYLGFKPAFFMYKRTDTLGNWGMKDNKRSGSSALQDFGQFNPNQTENPSANLNNVENKASGFAVDFLSNGIKIRGGDGNLNTNGGSYIYMAFAEAPLVGSNNVPCTAR